VQFERGEKHKLNNVTQLRRAKMKLKNNKSGFTLLEIIIVIIIVGVLASLALPRFFKTINYSRATEALNIMSTAKRMIDRCAIAEGAVTGAAAPVYNANCDTWDEIGMVNPTGVGGATFQAWTEPAFAAGPPITFTITAETAAASGHDVTFIYNATAGTVTRSGNGDYSGVK